VRRIRQFTHDEDYNLGLAVLPVLRGLRTCALWGSTQSQFVPGGDRDQGLHVGGPALFLTSGYSSKYVNGANSNRIASARDVLHRA